MAPSTSEREPEMQDTPPCRCKQLKTKSPPSAGTLRGQVENRPPTTIGEVYPFRVSHPERKVK